MALINVPDTDTFDIWRQKTNLLAQRQGDLALLITPVTTDLVSAINSLSASTDENIRSTLVRAIAMA